jgi:hypothetical protein
MFFSDFTLFKIIQINMKLFGFYVFASAYSQYIEFRGSCPEIPKIANFDVAAVMI